LQDCCGDEAFEQAEVLRNTDMAATADRVRAVALIFDPQRCEYMTGPMPGLALMDPLAPWTE
jgi:hypothetical protein